MKAIETEYNGYLFRSRLEARYAVFFDACNIKYEYELEGFELRNGKKYLPDFFLPQSFLYLEVKPPNVNDEVDGLMETFACNVGPIVLCKGNPNPRSFGRLYCYDVTDSGAGYIDGEIFCTEGKVFNVEFGFKCCREREFYDDEICTQQLPIQVVPGGYEEFFIVENAEKIAKQARFEHKRK